MKITLNHRGKIISPSKYDNTYILAITRIAFLKILGKDDGGNIPVMSAEIELKSFKDSVSFTKIPNQKSYSMFLDYKSNDGKHRITLCKDGLKKFFNGYPRRIYIKAEVP